MRRGAPYGRVDIDAKLQAVRPCIFDLSLSPPNLLLTASVGGGCFLRSHRCMLMLTLYFDRFRTLQVVWKRRGGVLNGTRAGRLDSDYSGDSGNHCRSGVHFSAARGGPGCGLERCGLERSEGGGGERTETGDGVVPEMD